MEINVAYLQNQSSLPSGFVQDINYVVSSLDSLFPANILLNIDVGFQNLGAGILGESEANQYVTASYSAVRSALQAEAAPGAAGLPASSPFPTGTLQLSIAEAQALGLAASGGLDGTVWFSNSFPFSYSQTTMPGANQYYFIGVVEHEITEVMGRVSFIPNSYSPLDLYRYSAPGVRDSGTEGTGSTAYFSVDNGATNLGTWNNNASNGDLADWYPQGPAVGGNDAFNDFSSPGVINVMSSTDITLMQALGWSGALATQSPSVISILETPSTGDLSVGKAVTITITLSNAVTIAGGTPTLTLSDNAAATYSSGSGTDALAFNYTVQTGQNTSDLTVSSINLNGATIQDGSGDNANLSLTGLSQSGPQIDTVAPAVLSIVESPAIGHLNTGSVVLLTVTLSEIVTVAGGTPTLTLNDGGVAAYSNGSGTDALTFSYTVQAGQNTPELVASSVNLNGASITDGAGNAADLSLSGVSQNGPQIDTPPTVLSVLETPASGNLDAGKTVVLTLDFSQAVTVANGTPTLTLSGGGVAMYSSGSGTNALSFSYTVQSGENTSELVAAIINLNGSTIMDAAGVAPDLSLASLSQTGPQIDTTAPTISSIVESPASGDLSAGHIVTLTVGLSEPVMVSGGVPTLLLNNGGIATFTGGSSSAALTFSYTTENGQNTNELTVASINLDGAAIQDTAGNEANLSLNGLPQAGPEIDTTPPTVSSLNATTDIGSNSINAGHLVTVTMSLSDPTAVTGTPSLQLNDNEVAVYTGGSGTRTLTFAYVVQTGDSTADLQVTGLNLPTGSSIVDAAGNALASANGDLALQVKATTAASTSQEIDGLYVTLFSVAPTASGITYWVNQTVAHDSSMTLASASSMAPISSADAQFLGQAMTAGSPIMSNGQTYFDTLYPATITDTQYIQDLYENIGGSQGTSGGIQYWTNQVLGLENQGDTVTQAREAIVGQFVHDFISNDLALGAAAWGISQGDWQLLMNGQQTLLDRIAVSQYWANITANNPNNVLLYSTISSAAFIDDMALLNTINSNPNSVMAAEQAITAASNSDSLIPIESLVNNVMASSAGSAPTAQQTKLASSSLAGHAPHIGGGILNAIEYDSTPNAVHAGSVDGVDDLGTTTATAIVGIHNAALHHDLSHV